MKLVEAAPSTGRDYVYTPARNGKMAFIRIMNPEKIEGAEIRGSHGVQIAERADGSKTELIFHKAVAFGDLADKISKLLQRGNKIKIKEGNIRDTSFTGFDNIQIEQKEIVIRAIENVLKATKPKTKVTTSTI